MNRRFLLKGTVLVAASAILAGCAQTEGADIVDIASSDDRFLGF